MLQFAPHPTGSHHQPGVPAGSGGGAVASLLYVEWIFQKLGRDFLKGLSSTLIFLASF
jgi:hypothetical protein